MVSINKLSETEITLPSYKMYPDYYWHNYWNKQQQFFQSYYPPQKHKSCTSLYLQYNAFDCNAWKIFPKSYVLTKRQFWSINLIDWIWNIIIRSYRIWPGLVATFPCCFYSADYLRNKSWIQNAFSMNSKMLSSNDQFSLHGLQRNFPCVGCYWSVMYLGMILL